MNAFLREVEELRDSVNRLAVDVVQLSTDIQDYLEQIDSRGAAAVPEAPALDVFPSERGESRRPGKGPQLVSVRRTPTAKER